MRQDTAQNWLQAACGITAAVGIGMAILAFEGAASATSALTEIVFNRTEDMTTPLSRLLTGIVGGVLAGWAVTMWLVVRHLHPRDPDLVRMLLLPGLIVWFVVDGIGSVVSGGGLNVIGNIGFLVLFLPPLVWGRPVPVPAKA